MKQKCKACGNDFEVSKSPYIDYGPTCGKKHNSKTKNEIADLIIKTHDSSGSYIEAGIEPEHFHAGLLKEGITIEEAEKIYTASSDFFDNEREWEAYEEQFIGDLDMPSNSLSAMFIQGENRVISHPNFNPELHEDEIFERYQDDEEYGYSLLEDLTYNPNTTVEMLERVERYDSFNSPAISCGLFDNPKTPLHIREKALEHLVNEYPQLGAFAVCEAIKIGMPLKLNQQVIASYLKIPADLEEVESSLYLLGENKKWMLEIKTAINSGRLDAYCLKEANMDLKASEDIERYLKEDIETSDQYTVAEKELIKLLE